MPRRTVLHERIAPEGRERLVPGDSGVDRLVILWAWSDDCIGQDGCGSMGDRGTTPHGIGFASIGMVKCTAGCHALLGWRYGLP